MRADLAVPGGPRRKRFSPETRAMPMRSMMRSLPTKADFMGLRMESWRWWAAEAAAEVMGQWEEGGR